MIILGIDCGLAITGWSVIEKKTQVGMPKLIGCGVVTTHKFTPKPDRLLEIGQSISKLISDFSPQTMAIEDIFYFKNAKTVISVSEARGVVLFQARRHQLEIFNYTPLQIKQTVTGYGRAPKSQMLTMLNDLFKLNGALKQDDAADALAVAYVHSLGAQVD